MVDAIKLGATHERHTWVNFSVQSSLDESCTLGRRFMLIDMGVGAVADDDVREFCRLVCDVGMQIMGNADGHIATQFFTKDGEDGALAIVVPFGDHRTMEL